MVATEWDMDVGMAGREDAARRRHVAEKTEKGARGVELECHRRPRMADKGGKELCTTDGEEDRRERRLQGKEPQKRYGEPEASVSATGHGKVNDE